MRSAERERDEIERRVPKVLRRVGGYNIDVFHPQSERPYTADGSVNLAHLLVGSEGTLAWSRALHVEARAAAGAPGARRRQFPDAVSRDGMRAAHRRSSRPSAVELVDRTMIDLARDNPAFRPTIDAALIGAPEAILLVEFIGETRDEPLRAARRSSSS